MSLSNIKVNNQEITSVEKYVAPSDNLINAKGVYDKLIDLTLREYVPISYGVLSNFIYFICKNPDILQYYPRINACINNSTFDHRIFVSTNNNDIITTYTYDGEGIHEDQNFLFLYDWSKHTESINLSTTWLESRIDVTGSSYSQSVVRVMDNTDKNFSNFENRKKFYDISKNSYSSYSITERAAVILEMYIEGDPFEDTNPLEFARFILSNGQKQLAFIRKNDGLWAFVIMKPDSYNDVSLEWAVYDNRNFYFYINWNANYTSGAVHSNVIISDGCYNLSNNPHIKDYYFNVFQPNTRLNLNRSRFYDRSSNSYNSDLILSRNRCVLEMYIDGEILDEELEFVRFIPQGSTDKQVCFINPGSNLWAFSIVRPLNYKNVQLEIVSYKNRTIYIIVNWGSEYVYPDGEGYIHSNVIVSDGCYYLDNNPAISAYIKNESVQREINSIASFNYPSMSKKIICSGSSITWGNGKLDDSMVLYLDKYIRDYLSTTILPSQMTFPQGYSNISNAMMYNDSGRKISNVGDTIEFDLYGDEIAICQMKRRTKTDYGIINVYADNVLIGKFDNKNFIKSDIEFFSGSNIREIGLKHSCTFNHIITINDSTVLNNIVYNRAGYGGTVPSNPSSFDAFVFRALDQNGIPVHRIQFSTALGTITSVSISYDYGNIVAYEKSTLGQTTDENQNESYYGAGSVSYDPAHPTTGISSGMEFRSVNKESFFVHKFTSTKTRHFKLELVGGTNPYFIINFATNRYHDIMNAGIGGWTISALIDNNKWGDYTEFFKSFKPEIVFQESETNDDWGNETRRIRRNIGEITLEELQKLFWLELYSVTYNSSTQKYNVDMCTGIIDSITYTSLVSQHIIGTQTQVGDIIRIGNYHGDIKQFTCREISEVNLQTGEVKWIEPISVDEMLNVESLQDLVGAEINIRNLDDYKTRYKTFIERVHKISPEATIIVVDNGLPMLGARQLWGYDIIHRKIVNESNNAVYCDARDVLYKGQFDNITGTKKETVTSTGSNAYNLSFVGSAKSWCGFKVLVNGIDVYGRDCYIECQCGYRAKRSLSGSSLNKTSPYDRNQSEDVSSSLSMRLVFTKNVPTSNDSIEVWYSDEIWSGDYCHPNSFGSFLYGQAYSKFIE